MAYDDNNNYNNEYDYQSNTVLSNNHDCNECHESSKMGISQRIENPPGLKAISYRIGTYNDFKKNLLEKISQKRMLRKLTSRSDDDQSISLLDAWAVVADVLTFYQERIANEAYLRTSNDPRSILELARSVGYEPRPGTSAGAFVQFNIENSPESIGKETKIDAGVKLQSLPAQGETPQIFETVETIKARPEWNQLTPNLTRPQVISENTSVFYFKGIDTKLKPNDRLLILTQQDSNTDKSNDTDNKNKRKGTDKDRKKKKKIKPSNESKDENIYRLGNSYLKYAIKVVEKIEVNAKLGRTMVTVFSIESKSTYEEKQTSLLTNEMLNDAIVDISGKLGKPIPRQSLDLNKLNQTDLTGVAIKYGWSIDDFFKMLNEEFKQKQRELTAKTKVYAFHIQSNLFGYNAPKRDSVPTNIAIGHSGDWGSYNICDFYSHVSQSPNHKEKITIYLDNIYPRIISKSWIILESSKKEDRQNIIHQVARPLNILYTTDETLTGFFSTGIKITSLAVDLEDVQIKCEDFRLSNTTVYAQSEELFLTDERPLTDNSNNDNNSSSSSSAAAAIKNNSISFDRLVNGLDKGRYLSINGALLADKSGDKKSQIVKISEINISPNRSFNLFTEVKFENNNNNITSASSYKADTLTLNANVSYVTHGVSTVEEAIGSGDPSIRQQEFVLKQSPLAYIPSATGEVGLSTLEIRINGILWKEVPASRFHFMKPTDQVYMTRKDANGKTHIIFGDPAARPPLGIGNIVGTYRVGGGSVGNVKENQINILVTRPLGVKSVSNPTAIQPASNPEDPQSVRSNIPNMVNTSQRIFSLEDFESFALTFKGISKAKAVWIWNQVDNIISLTIASDDGSPVDPKSQLYKDLYTSISEKKDPTIEFRLNSFSKKFFTAKLTIKITSDRVTDKQAIISQITDVLQTRFSFDSRQFGQPVSKEEIIIAVQQVQAVVMVEDVFLYILDGDRNGNVCEIYSNLAHWNDKTNQISEAELLIIQKDTINIDVEEMRV